MVLDHLILSVNDMAESLPFYCEVLGLASEGESGPFTVLRVSADLTIQLAPWGTQGGIHLAFAMKKPEFDAAFARIREAGLEFGDSFHSVGNGEGPGEEVGARGPGPTLYVHDPNRHLIEIRHYD